MAIAIPFDTLAFVKELETAGVPVPQAEAQARALTTVLQKVDEVRLAELVTKEDLQLEIEKLRRDVEVRLAETKADLYKWVVGVSAGQAMLVVALIKLLPGAH